MLVAVVLAVRISRPTSGAIADVRCVSAGHAVVVTAQVKRNSNVAAYQGLAAFAYDADGRRIGSNDDTVVIQNMGETGGTGPQRVRMDLDVTGTPATCEVVWGPGGPNQYTGHDRLIVAGTQVRALSR
jgi:hypothetical protein